MKRILPILLGFLLLAVSAAQAQFNYTTNSGAITLTGYSGPGGAVTIPDSINGLPISTIAASAFFFANVTSVTIPGSVTNLGANAFNYCSNLVRVYFQGNAPAADSTVFAHDPKTTAYYLAGTIGWGSTFAGLPVMLWNPQVPVGDYGFTTNGGAITIISYSGAGGVVTIPDTINGLPVTSIGPSAFAVTAVTSVTIPSGITNIGDRAFEICTSLTNVTLENGLMTIGATAFGATGMASVTIPASVTSIGPGAFSGCFYLMSVYFNGNAPVDGGGVFFQDSRATAYFLAGTTGWNSTFGLIPTMLWAQHPIGGYTFTTNAGAITITGYTGPGGAVTIPATITGLPVIRIGETAFYRSSVTSVTIPDSVNDIAVEAFGYCTNLSNVTMGNGVVSIEGAAFLDCSSLSDITIPASVTSIGEQAFDHCPLTTVTIPGSVTIIGSYAFAACPLRRVFFQGNAPTFGPSVFDFDNNATIYYFLGAAGWGYTVDRLPVVLWNPLVPITDYIYVTNAGSIKIIGYSGPGSALTIPATINDFRVTGIESNAFQGSSLTSVTIPGTVTNIGDNAFAFCTNLTDVSILDGVIRIESFAFASCTSLSNISIPGSVKGIGESAFQSCLSLVSVALPGGVTNVESNTFASCPSLTGVTIPDSVISIGDSAFQSCTSLTYIMIPGGVTAIGAKAFSATGLSSVTIPASVTNLAGGAFEACTNLTSVVFLGNLPSADSSTFLGDNATIYYLPGTTGWSSTFAGVPAKLLNPVINPVSQVDEANFGVRNNQIAFDVIGANNTVLVVEATTSLASPLWFPLQTIKLTNGLFHFSEPVQLGSPGRFYRLSLP